MWTLFTKALARGSSTTQVSIMNTSTNFMITAFLGLMIFSESLPPLWWVGAAMLVAGNVIIGRKDEGGDEATTEDENAPVSGTEPGASNVSNYGAAAPVTAAGIAPEKDDDEEDVPLLGDLEDERNE
jgi:drug/metabolite transporter (DMT)-like permease